MKAFIQSQKSKIDVPAFSVAAAGFRSLNIPVELFEKNSIPPAIFGDDIVVGSVDTTRLYLSSNGITLTSIDYPEELSEYFDRSIKTSSIKQLLNDNISFPIFIKPVEEKLFCGTVINCINDLTKISAYPDSTPIFISSFRRFISEWRFFIRYGEIIGYCPYVGHPKDMCDIKTVQKAVSSFKSAPCGYALDFGLTDNGTTVLIEVNDGYSLCNYILPEISYAKLLISRWSELTGVADPFKK